MVELFFMFFVFFVINVGAFVFFALMKKEKYLGII